MQIESYIKNGERFVPISEFEGPVADSDYIEGAMVLTINELEVFNQEMWDYVDQLWEYLIDAVSETIAGREASFFFPDQPIEVKVRPSWNGTGIEFEVLRRSKKLRTSTDKRQFVGCLCDAGEMFFRKMREVNPGNKLADENVLLKLGKLRQSVG